MLKNVRKDIDTFVGSAPQFDDITMLGLHYSGKQETGDQPDNDVK
jgi:sigma-B regulation protein RsbU (phosphoserine phosphatase)